MERRTFVKLVKKRGASMLKLNLGCADLKLDGYINIDKRQSVKPDLVMDVREIDKNFGKESVDEIYAGHFLEHLTPNEALELLERCYKLLKSGGKLCIVVPDFRVIAKMYLDGKESVEKMNDFYIYSYVQESLHKSLWDIPSLEKLFLKAGFVRTKEIDRIKDPRVAFGVEWQCGIEGTK